MWCLSVRGGLGCWCLPAVAEAGRKGEVIKLLFYAAQITDNAIVVVVVAIDGREMGGRCVIVGVNEIIS